MGALWPRDRILNLALLASLALHLVVAYLIPSLTSFTGEGPSVETISFARIVHLIRTNPHLVIRKQMAAAPVHAVRPQHTPLTQRAGPHRVAPRPREHQQSRAPVAATVPQTTLAVQEQSTQSPAPVAPSPPVQQQTQSTQTRYQTSGYMPLGVTQAVPVLDPDILKSLEALGVHITLIVCVGEDGRTRAVSFQPDVTPAVENEIRSLLASASWDPAICGAGMACAATATIKL